MGVTFRLGIAFPESNASGYQQVFALEQWMRRIALVAIAAEFGPNVNGAIPPEIIGILKERRALLARSEYLGIARPDDLLSLSTLEELRLILVADSIFPSVRRLTGYTRELVSAKLSEIREIRNAVGHNRLLSDKTCRILDAAVLSLVSGIDRVRSRVAIGPERRGRIRPPEDPDLMEYFRVACSLRPSRIISDDRLGVYEDGAWYFASLLPRHLAVQGSDEASFLGQWIDVERLLGALEDANPIPVAVVLPLRGTSFELVWPRRSSGAQHKKLLETFVGVIDDIWGIEDYGQQDHEAFVHPRLWFSEDVEGPAASVFGVRTAL